MITYIRNIIESIKLFLQVSSNMKMQREYIAKHLTPIIDEAKATNDGSLDDEDFKKIQTYGLTVPAMLGEAFCKLRAVEITDKEHKAITFLASMTGLFDDLFDRKNVSENYILDLLDNPTMSDTTASNEKLLINLYTQALENSDKQDTIKSQALKVFYAQVASKRQNNGNLNREEIQKITFDKGGVSMPFYRCAFDGEIDKAEYQMLYYLGAIGQLENDIFDIYKDYIAGIQTLATIETNISNLQSAYRFLMDKISELIDQTSYQPQNKQEFKLFANLVICRGLVGLDLLRRNAKRTQGVFSITKYNRKDLICDMESPLNVLKLLHYAALCNKK